MSKMVNIDKYNLIVVCQFASSDDRSPQPSNFPDLAPWIFLLFAKLKGRRFGTNLKEAALWSGQTVEKCGWTRKWFCYFLNKSRTWRIKMAFILFCWWSFPSHYLRCDSFCMPGTKLLPDPVKQFIFRVTRLGEVILGESLSYGTYCFHERIMGSIKWQMAHASFRIFLQKINYPPVHITS